MEKVDAFKCSITGQLFDDPRDAARCEFRALMQKVGGNLPAMGSIDPKSIMNWLASSLEGTTYMAGLKAFLDAADYLRAHHETIASKR